MDDDEFSEMHEMQSTATKRRRKQTESSPALWSSATSLKKKLITLSELEDSKFYKTILELATQFDHVDVKHSFSLSCKVRENLKKKCNVSFRGQVTQNNFKFLLALACCVSGDFFANVPELTLCLTENDFQAPVEEMALKVFSEFFVAQVAVYLTQHINEVGARHH